jgi:hypothetical protein
MADFGVSLVEPFPAQALDTIGANTSTSRGVTIPDGGANTWGAWTTMTASTSQAYKAIIVGVQGAADTSMVGDQPALVQVGIGGTSSEVSMLAPIMIVGDSQEAWAFVTPVVGPYSIPASSRLSVRWSTFHTSNSLDAIIYGVPAAA